MSLKDAIIGNERIVEVLNKSYVSGKTAHAYLFEGPEHMGKMTLAINFCALLTDDAEENILRNTDITILCPNEDEKVITVEAIRGLEKNLSLYPYHSKYKIAIIDQAEKMNKAAANALLKTLEEPAKTAVIILITSNSKNILDTVKSRCQVMKFLPIKKRTLEKFLENKISDLSEAKKIIELAGYKPGKMIEFANDGKKIIELAEYIDRFSDVIGKDENERLNEAEIVCKKEMNEIVELLDLWTMHLRKLLIGEYNRFKKDRNNIFRLKSRIDLLIRTKNDLLNMNINAKLAIENMFLGL